MTKLLLTGLLVFAGYQSQTWAKNRSCPQNSFAEMTCKKAALDSETAQYVKDNNLGIIPTNEFTLCGGNVGTESKFVLNVDSPVDPRIKNKSLPLQNLDMGLVWSEDDKDYVLFVSVLNDVQTRLMVVDDNGLEFSSVADYTCTTKENK